MKIILFSVLFCLGNVFDVGAAAAEEVRDSLKLRHQLIGHKGLVRTMLSLPGGRLVTGSDDTTVRLWDLKTKQCLYIFRGQRGPHTSGHAAPVISLANFVDDKAIMSGGEDGTVHIWDVQNGYPYPIGLIKYENEPASVAPIRPVYCLATAMNGYAVLPKGNVEHAEYAHNLDDRPFLQSESYRQGKHTSAGIQYSNGTVDSTLPVEDVTTYSFVLNNAAFFAQGNKRRDPVGILAMLQKIKARRPDSSVEELTLLSDGNVAIRKPGRSGIIQIMSGESGELLQEIDGYMHVGGAIAGLPAGGLAIAAADCAVDIYLYDRPKKDIRLYREEEASEQKSDEEKKELLEKTNKSTPSAPRARKGSPCGSCIIL